MSTLPTLVFIPGAWHKPTCYDKIAEVLEKKHQLKCVLVTLPSTTGNPEASFKNDLDAARDAISKEIAQERNVVLVAHSYGGIVANSSIKGFAQTRGDAAESANSACIVGLILIASGFTMTGMTFMDPFFDHPPPTWRVNKETGFADFVTPPRELFYHDLPAEEAEYRVSELGKQSLKSMFEGREHTYAGWQDVPAWYIGTTEDRGMPVAAQRLNVGMAREMGGKVEHRELQTSHSPFLSQPGTTAKIIVEAVLTFTGRTPDLPKSSATEDGRAVVAAPKATLWPSTWLRYGLPLALGHIIGRCFLLYTGTRRLWRSTFGFRNTKSG